MTVAELIAELKKYPEDLRVTLFDTEHSYYRDDFVFQAFEDDLTLSTVKVYGLHQEEK